MQTQNVPLSRFPAVDTHAPDDAREAIGRIFCPHFLSPVERNPRAFHARHHTVEQADYSVNFVSYGATVDIDPGELSRFFLLQIPIEGAARVRCGTVSTDVVSGQSASLLSPTLPTRMTWQEGCEKLILLVRREAVEAQFQALTHEVGRDIEFDPRIDLSAPMGQALWRHSMMMLAAAEEPGATPRAYQILLRDGLTTLLLTGFANNRSRAFSSPAPTAGPSAVMRAKEFIRANAARAVSMEEVAAAAGVSLRSLQDSYKRSQGLTLGEGLLDARLICFREGLLAAGPSATVAEIAFAAGFGHLGRAAAAYRARFGETPSETLRRRKQ
ncbi:AraC family transcriptional regulator [Rhizobium sp. KVB221]|uniref:AraC family transcriptional regulator n=1 Tax=Rhizobium setariae TaxID=2801340 RepID=A0A936YUG4_9HYPH|nr:AraC family transcriptional regulator [Rhizobium setariae]MBL0372810.1 AraC family transcriptional regulator [Rhizobium setariae]